jgi:hypothetical protein
VFWLFNQYGFCYHVHYIPKDPTHKHTHTPLVCLATTFSFSMPFPPPPVPISPDTLCCVLMGWKCAVYIRGKGANCTFVTYPMGIQLFMAEGHNRYCGLVHGPHVGKITVHAIPNCLTIVKYLRIHTICKCGSGLQIWHGAPHVEDPWVMSTLSLTQP